MNQLLELIHEAINIYNKYRSVEAKCSLENIENEEIYLKFEGHFCLTCGVIDWIEDMIYILKDLGINARIEKVEYYTEQGYVKTRIKILSHSSQNSNKSV